jgi:small-conductance mechanosensitive channel
VGSDFRHAINDRFKAAGIEIPYPQRVITVKYQKPEEEKKDQTPAL